MWDCVPISSTSQNVTNKKQSRIAFILQSHILSRDFASGSGKGSAIGVERGFAFVLSAARSPDVCSAPSPVVAGSPYDMPKNRYISFDPAMLPFGAVAFRVDKVTAPTGTCWVGEPDELGYSECVENPVYRVWTETVVNVGDCEIVPVADYEVRATVDGTVFSAALAVSTIDQPSGKYWGDVAGTNTGSAWTAPNGIANVNDILAVLARARGDAIAPLLQAANLETVSSDDSCLNSEVNAADVFIVVKAVNGAEYPFSQDPAACPSICNPVGGLEDGGFAEPESFVFGDDPAFSLSVEPYQISAGETVDVDVFVDVAESVGAYEVALEVSGGTTGSVTREAVAIDNQHSGFIFGSQGVQLVLNNEANRAGAALSSGAGLMAVGTKYLATYSFEASQDADGIFEVRVDGNRSYLLDADGITITSDPGGVAYIRVGVECTEAIHCDDGNQCTSDTCATNQCVNTNLSNGTGCDDGMYCTLTDTCNGSGVCVGSSSPCGRLAPVCCEETDSCHPTGYECGMEM